MKTILIFLFSVVGIPALGIAIFSYIVSDWDAENLKNGIPSYEQLCAISVGDLREQGSSQELIDALTADCATYNLLSGFMVVSWAALAAALALPALFWGSALLIGKRRVLMATLFPPVLRVSLLILAVSAAAQGVIFAALVYYGESHFVGRVHFAIAGAAALGGLLAAGAIASQSLSIAKGKPLFVIGKTLPQPDSTGIWKLVEDISSKVGARRPDNVVIGLEPNFFATSAPVQVFNEQGVLKGETLYLSAPLLRVFNQSETAAVVGHELGHFQGEDTKYSMKFAPMYRQLQRSIDDLSRLEGAMAIAAIPAVGVLNLMLMVFARNERTIGRQRELEADRAGAKAGSPEAIISALVKVALVAPSYQGVKQYNLEKLSDGEVLKNLSSMMQFVASEQAQQIDAHQVVSDLGTSVASHPIDTHPTLAARAEALSVNLYAACTVAVDELKEHHSKELVEDPLAAIEEEASMAEHRFAVAAGQVVLPKPSGEAESAQPE